MAKPKRKVTREPTWAESLEVEERLAQARNDVLDELRRRLVNLSHFDLTAMVSAGGEHGFWRLTSSCDRGPRWCTASIGLSAPEAAERLFRIPRKCCERGMLEVWRERGIDAVERAGLSRQVSASTRAIVVARDGMVCGICGRPVSPEELHIDHVKPFARGGDSHAMNLQVTHRACNLRKGARMWEEPTP